MSLEVPAHSNHAGKPASRIRQKNEQAILQAAEDEFARHGYKGTSMNTIAASAGLPKANLHYYFTNKLGLYVAVLSNILELWDSTFNALTAEDDPAVALTRYIRTKMEFSRRHPQASRIFAMAASASSTRRVSISCTTTSASWPSRATSSRLATLHSAKASRVSSSANRR